MKAGIFHELNIGDVLGQKTASKSFENVKKTSNVWEGHRKEKFVS